VAVWSGGLLVIFGPGPVWVALASAVGGLVVLATVAAVVLQRPRVVITPDGFTVYTLFGEGARRWRDVHGEFAVIRIGWVKAVGYNLTTGNKARAGYSGYGAAITEVVRRARELLEKIRDEVQEEHLQFRPHDVVYTAESKNTGRIASPTLTVLTSQFGEQQLKLADARELRSPSAAESEPANALPDPGSLASLMGQVGRVYTFRVTGVVGMAGWLWGSDTYTLDSNLALAAVHAGVLKAGQNGVVRVKILGAQPAFAGSTRNGVTSHGYGAYNGSFEFVRPRRGHSERR
jgi:hypothetical protein